MPTLFYRSTDFHFHINASSSLDPYSSNFLLCPFFDWFCCPSLRSFFFCGCRNICLTTPSSCPIASPAGTVIQVEDDEDEDEDDADDDDENDANDDDDGADDDNVDADDDGGHDVVAVSGGQSTSKVSECRQLSIRVKRRHCSSSSSSVPHCPPAPPIIISFFSSSCSSSP